MTDNVASKRQIVRAMRLANAAFLAALAGVVASLWMLLSTPWAVLWTSVIAGVLALAYYAAAEKCKRDYLATGRRW